MTTPAPVRVLHSDADHAAALAEYEGYFDGEPGSGRRIVGWANCCAIQAFFALSVLEFGIARGMW